MPSPAKQPPKPPTWRTCDFVSVEHNPTSATLWDLCVWTVNGDKIVVRTDTQATCEENARKIKQALRTFGGWS